MGDAEALASALINILENAVKFAPEKGRISVRMDWQPASLEIHVTNTFGELSKQDLLRIFDPFYRIKRAAAAGSGLGLTIARKVIERHGGTIEARNTEKGLEIIISLPRNLL
jgi:signal transduction histidine kinase